LVPLPTLKTDFCPSDPFNPESSYQEGTKIIRADCALGSERDFNLEGNFAVGVKNQIITFPERSDVDLFLTLFRFFRND
jgi:hypothetical protein